MAARVWDCACLFSSGNRPRGTGSSALIVLNTPISQRSGPIFRTLWDSTDLHICADGGANRLHELDPSLLPDRVVGDLDSLRPEIKSAYTAQGVPILLDEDQYSTDLGKCLSSIIADPFESITIHGGLSGRLDQTIHTLHMLMAVESGTDEHVRSPPYQRWRGREERGKDKEEVWVVDSDAGSAACFLAPGKHRIRVRGSERREGGEGSRGRKKTCGLLPIGCDEAVYSTRGLEWDLTGTVSTMRGMVSTSNQIPLTDDRGRRREWVEVDVDRGSLVWTMDLALD